MSEKSENTTLKQLTLFAGDSPARTSASPERERVSRESDQDCGLNSIASFASFDLDMLSWRTSQRSLFGGWMLYSENWPRAGMMRNGKSFQQRPLVPNISGSGYSFWPTPKAQTGREGISPRTLEMVREGIAEASLTRIVLMPERWPPGSWKEGIGKHPNPQFLEWLMGFPTGWTDLEHSETP